ncbi:Uncharacterised protein [Vibrio cholerae]|uniref:Uncharacterized protein n=1 Tax=Vibrio cholerae TaxID=666 RepID=A0A655YH19_VIBCL|nr:hypothetical protein VCHC1A2_1124 [Vibrio cholerae HC-1A2]EMP86381.1 hypothetical protein VC116063_001688 [Vibrio cholerae O1 str. 116063]CSC38624.1 Uncharacterised protein [Vibrio cholerae]
MPKLDFITSTTLLKPSQMATSSNRGKPKRNQGEVTKLEDMNS